MAGAKTASDVFQKKPLTFTCFSRVPPGQSSPKGQRSSVCAAGMWRCQPDQAFTKAPRRSMEGEQLLFVRGRWGKKNQFPIEFPFHLIVLYGWYQRDSKTSHDEPTTSSWSHRGFSMNSCLVEFYAIAPPPQSWVGLSYFSRKAEKSRPS